MRPSAGPDPHVEQRRSRSTMDALARTGDVFEVFFEQAGVGLALADLSTRFVRVNDAYAALVGRSAEDLVGVSFRDLLHDDGSDRERDVTLLLRGDEAAMSAEERYVRPSGEELYVLHGVRVVRDAEGDALWFAVSAQDVTARRRAVQELHALTAALTERAVRDPLTGLANRALLEERLRGALARDARTGSSTGLLFLDLDGFKAVNDRHGHAVGDDVLREVARRLLTHVRPSDTVARLGGDEFVVLVEQATPEGLASLAARLEQAVTEPFSVGVVVQTGVSVGAATSRAGEADVASLLAAADRRMYAVKRARQS